MDDVKFKRIERLLKDLEYELASGFHQNQIDEKIAADFFIGAVSRDYPAWRMMFIFEPVNKYDLMMQPAGKQYEGLRLVKGDKS